MEFTVNDNEMVALCGLPHVQQLAYFRGIRLYMNVKTWIVGIDRGICYQSIAEQLYIEPHHTSDYSDSYKPDLRFFRICSEMHKKMKLSHQSLAPNLRLIKKGGRVRILVKIGLFTLKAVYHHTYDWFISR